MSRTAIMAHENARNLARMVAIALTDGEARDLMRANRTATHKELSTSDQLKEMSLICRRKVSGIAMDTITPWGMFVCQYIEDRYLRG